MPEKIGTDGSAVKSGAPSFNRKLILQLFNTLSGFT